MHCAKCWGECGLDCTVGGDIKQLAINSSASTRAKLIGPSPGRERESSQTGTGSKIGHWLIESTALRLCMVIK